MFPNLPFVGYQGGYRTPFSTVLPPTGRLAAYVRSSGPASYDDSTVAPRIVTTLAAALGKVRAGLGDTVVVLPGHSENVTDATMLDNLVNGTRIIGAGHPMQDDAPTFRWTTTTAQWIIDNKNTVISNLRLRLEGAVVVKGIVTTAAGCTLRDCVIQTASGASNKATIGIEVGSGATEHTIQNNYLYGSATHNSTDVIKVVGGTVPSQLCILDNTGFCSATAANGLVHVTVAALNILIARNTFFNTHTASTSCITIDNVAASGIAAYNNLATINDGTVTAQGLVQGAGSLVRGFQNFSCDEPIKSGVLTPAAAT